MAVCSGESAANEVITRDALGLIGELAVNEITVAQYRYIARQVGERVCGHSVLVYGLPNANVVCEPLRGLDSCLRRNDRVVSGVWQHTPA